MSYSEFDDICFVFLFVLLCSCLGKRRNARMFAPSAVRLPLHAFKVRADYVAVPFLGQEKTRWLLRHSVKMRDATNTSCEPVKMNASVCNVTTCPLRSQTWPDSRTPDPLKAFLGETHLFHAVELPRSNMERNISRMNILFIFWKPSYIVPTPFVPIFRWSTTLMFGSSALTKVLIQKNLQAPI